MNPSTRTILIVAVLFIIGCVTKADYLTEFSVSGTVYDKETNAPINSADIVFVDKGFDYYRSTINYSLKVCNTDELGVFEQDFEYFWGAKKAWFYKKPTKAFEILIKRDGFIDKRSNFLADDLTRKDGRLVVLVGDIFLEKNK